MAFKPGQSPESGHLLPVSLRPSASGWLVTVDTAQTWLRDDLASGPVLVDPTVYVSGSQTCSITEDTPKTGYCASKEFQVGYDSTHKEHHGLLEFNTSSLPGGAVVLHATLGLYLEAHSTSTGKAVGVYRVTKPWTTAASWEAYDGTHAWSTPGGDYANPGSESDASVIPSVGTATGWYHWYPTKMVQEWVNGASAPAGQGYANEGLIVKDETDNLTANLLTFASPTATSNQPYLEVAYEPRGEGSEPQYTMLSTPLTDRSTMRLNAASGDLMIEADDLELSGVAGLGFTSTRTWNSLNPEQQEYGQWSDSNADIFGLYHYADGTVSIETGNAAWLTFIKQANSSFITPPGIKAVMCTIGSPAPCPTSLPSGVKFRLIYDASQDHIDYSESGGGLDVQDRYNNKIAHEWTGKESQVYTDTRGHKIEELSNSETWLTEIKDISGSRNTKYAYEKTEAGTVLKTYTDASGKTTTYGYEGSKLASITDPVGNVTKFFYDSSHRVTEIIRTTNSEHTKGPTTKISYYEGGSVPAGCSGSAKATLIKDPDWSSEKAHETLYCSNVLDEVEKTIDASGNATSATYNPFGDRLTTTASAPGGSESGNVVSHVYGEGGVNLLCTVTGASGSESSCPSKRSALVTSYGYVDKSNPYSSTEATNPQGNEQYACYNFGKQEGGKGPACPTSEAKAPPGTLQNINDTLATEHELSFAYNENGTLKSATDSSGHTTEYAYDERGNPKEIKPPVPLAVTTVKVDADGRPEVLTDGAGHKQTITYDKLDRVTKVEYAGTGTAKTVSYEYDGDGNVLKREDSTGTAKYTVDPLNRLTKEELPGSVTHSYEYDAASNMASYTDGGGTTTYKYNGLNELESMTEPKGIGTDSFTYDNDQRLTKVTYPSKASETFKLEATTGRPERITPEGITGTSVPTLSYTYKSGENDTSLVQSVSESGASTTSYSYDQLDRLTKAITTGASPSFYKFKLDGTGNRLEQKVNLSKAEEAGSEATYYAYNSANELECRQTVAPPCSKSSSTELSAYEYDKAGEQLAITPKGDTSGATFAYNAASELSTLTPSGESALSLSYGGTGQDDLITRGSSATIENSLLGITREVVSGNADCFERTPTGLLVDIRTPSGNYNPLFDAQGSVIGLVSSSGKVERNFRYGPYGENVKSEGTQTIPYPFGYKGGYRMPAGNTGKGNVTNSLLHFGQRYYDPTTGRWTQRDPSPVANPVQGNRFAFAAGDPINESDPSGLSVEAYLEDCGKGAAEGAAKSALTGDGVIAGAVGGCAVSAGIRGAAELFSENEEEESEDIEQGEFIAEVAG